MRTLAPSPEEQQREAKAAAGAQAAAIAAAAAAAAADSPFASRPGCPPPYKVKRLGGELGVWCSRCFLLAFACHRDGALPAFALVLGSKGCQVVLMFHLRVLHLLVLPRLVFHLNYVRQVKAFVELAASLLSTTGRPGRPGSQAAQQTAVSAEIVRAMKDAGARCMHFAGWMFNSGRL